MITKQLFIFLYFSLINSYINMSNFNITLEIPYNEKLEHRRPLCIERERDPLHILLVATCFYFYIPFLFMGRRDSLAKERPCYRKSRYRESRVYIINFGQLECAKDFTVHNIFTCTKYYNLLFSTCTITLSM